MTNKNIAISLHEFTVDTSWLTCFVGYFVHNGPQLVIALSSSSLFVSFRQIVPLFFPFLLRLVGIESKDFNT